MLKRLPSLISMLILIGFLIPYIWKLKELSLLILLVVGVILAMYDFYISGKKQDLLVPQKASYDSEST
jgi:uncharacterized membrane protein (UPF0136 family)